MIFDSPVYPIPPSFDSNEELELESTTKYIDYLEDAGANILMSTAGTSQFNLLDLNEVRSFNESLCAFSGKKIIGLPALSFFHIKKEITDFYNKFSDINLLLLFPDRYYSNKQIVSFFGKICELSSNPILIHGTSVRKGSSGIYEYDHSLLKELSTIDGILGIKEESSNLSFAMNNIQDLNLEIIVAGGSMRRFWSLEPFGATTYLAGVGSFNPRLEEDFYRLYKKGDLSEAKGIIENFETPFFNTSMTIGWHASMRFGLNHLGLLKGNRAPFVELEEDGKNRIAEALSLISIQ